MKTTNFVWAFFACIISINTTFAQPSANTPRDGFYDKVIAEEQMPLQRPEVQERDVAWAKRVWRVVDTREKFNHTFSAYEAPLIDILMTAIRDGEINAYHQSTDDFSVPLSEQERQQCGLFVDTICTIDPVTWLDTCEVVYNETNPQDITRFRIKEDWFYNKATERLEVRILGIAPIIDKYDDNGNFIGSMPMFWVYYPELDGLLSKHTMPNSRNDAAQFSWYDAFEARLFDSYIYKVSNVQNNRIQDTHSGIDILTEAALQEEIIRNFESDFWEY